MRETLAAFHCVPASAALQGIVPVIALALFGAAAMIARATPDPLPPKDQSRHALDTSAPLQPGVVRTISYRRPAGDSIDNIQLASLVPVAREEARAPRIVQDVDVDIELPAVPRRDVDDPMTALAQATGYLVETATPGGTMTRQGPQIAIERLYPEFRLRLAAAIREARIRGLPCAGIFSAYRPPAFGVGGFRDKFNSLHSYGLAVDLKCVGRPGSRDARHWHSIARRHGVVCPYGPNNRAEFNHCQPTNLKVVARKNPLRATITAKGPLDIEKMWATATAIIVSVANAATPEASKKVAKAKVRAKPKAKKTRYAKRTKRSKRARYARRS